MLVLGILVFLSGALLFASGMLARRKRNREERESLQRVRQDLAARRALGSHPPQALVKMDSRGLIRRVNGAAERLFGYDEAELLGDSILQLLPFAPSALNPATMADDQGAIAMEVRRKDRSTVKVRMTGTRSESENGSHIYVFFEAVADGEQRDAEVQPGGEQAQSRGAAASA